MSRLSMSGPALIVLLSLLGAADGVGIRLPRGGAFAAPTPSPITAAATPSVAPSRTFEKFRDFILQRQKTIVQDLEALDGTAMFRLDDWRRSDTTYGVTGVLEGGSLIEKGAVSVSIIQGTLTEERARTMSSRGRKVREGGGQPYCAAALSLVVHAAHPMVPTLRADVRYFEVADDGHSEPQGWFGGGADLTPCYLFEEDAIEWHKHWRGVCDKYSPDLYPRYKKWCDEYFYLPARQEHRGIGGIFFDDLMDFSDLPPPPSPSPSTSPTPPTPPLEFVQDVADGLLDSWRPIVDRRRSLPYTPQQREWQLVRRGRYVEFNLLYDRGVRFGLAPGGAIERVIVSAPPLVKWSYRYGEPGEEERRLVDVLRKPRDWADETD